MKNSDKKQLIPMHGQRNRVKLVILSHIFEKFGQFNLTVDDQYPKSPKNVITD